MLVMSMTTRLFHIGMIFSLVALTAFLMPTTVLATKSRSVSFEQSTFELVPGISQSLRGLDAAITCSDGTTISGPLFDFSAIRDGRSNSGSWQMIAAPGAAAGDAGSFDNVKITPKQFKLQGLWDDRLSRGNSVVCFDAPIPAYVVIQGQCGVGMTVTLKATNGVV
ncbi:MAG: hypothetical protein ACREAW_02120, partial [Nitrososphaera sp.]